RRRGCAQHPADNRLKTTKYTLLSFLPKNLFEQFHRLANVYFVLVALLNFVPALSAFQPGLALAPVLFILAVTALKDLWEDFSRRRSDHEINHLGCLVFSREEKRYVKRFWKDIRVGDFVRLHCNEVIPADVLLLASSDPDGLCHIETATLDGEANLKRRQVVRGFSELVSEFNPLTFTSAIECERPNNDLTRFRGCIIHDNGKKAGLHKENLLLRGCTIRNTEAVVGIVIYAGHETKALLTNSGPRYKRSLLERQMNCDVLWCVLLLICMSLFSAVGHGLWMRWLQEKKSLFDVPRADGSPLSPVTAAAYSFLTMIIILQVLIPISLYVSIEIVKVCQVYFIHQDAELHDEETDSRLQCRALNITEDLGQVQYVFSDKTGTLTENKLVFRRCTVSGVEYSHDANSQRLATYQEADSEEEEAVPRASSTPRRDSIGSCQGVRLPHRTQSTRSHRRASSRSETKRTAILSKHTAFSSPMEKDVTPDPKLLEKVRECVRRLSVTRHQEQPLALLSPELSDVFDFFIALTVCNTVVVTSPDQPRQKAEPQVPPSPPLARNGYSSPVADWAPEHDRQPAPEPGLQQEPELRYEAESPDEAALVYAARAYSCTLVGRLQDRVAVELPRLGRLSFELLHVLGFDATRKRMSVVIRHPLTRKVHVYTKGADSVVMGLLLPCSSDDARGRHQRRIRSETQSCLDLYAVEGLRTLCIAKRVLSEEEYADWLEGHLEAESSLDNREELLSQSASRLETNLHLLGATGIEDRLQEGVPETIMKLRQAGLQIWVLTGDKRETALNVAYACRLLDQEEELLALSAKSREACAALLDQCLHYVQTKGPHGAPTKTSSSESVGFSPVHPGSTPTPTGHSLSLVVDGQSLAFALEKALEDKFLCLARQCHCVLCCRVTPLQKSMVVKLVRTKLKAMTLAIGDGANDVSMIQVADVGVGISGQEGMQAVMASDFAVPRFRYLERLLIVHGHWCYSRLANMVLYFFYKNTMFVGLLFWFQFCCGFSASTMVDQWYLIFFNLLFSSLPQLVTGVLDKDVPARVLLAKPQLYQSGQNREEYRPRTFWMNMADATFQSLVCFFLPYLAYYDSDVDLFTWGTPITAIALFTFLLHLGIETKTWTWLNWLACGFSVFLFFTVALVYNASCATCYPPSNAYWTMHTLLGEPLFYLTCLIAPVAALLPRLFFRAVQGSLFPTQLQLSRQSAKKVPRRLETPAEAFAQGCPPGVPRAEHPKGRAGRGSMSQSQDHRSVDSWYTQPARSPEASREPSAGDTGMPLKEDTRLGQLGTETPGASVLGEATVEGRLGHSGMRPTSPSRAVPLAGLVGLPSLGAAPWLPSLSLVSGLQSVLQLSRGGLKVGKPGGKLLACPLPPERALAGLAQTTEF
ncbi:probable phospholipid-transporting ATPase VA, partial [Tupaia chinensis]|uniref:probable phospholipid-transporting ATPase VA n=1 Tax=Tupaia chinensis TaxID=246437 RepID=UPI0003C8D630